MSGCSAASHFTRRSVRARIELMFHVASFTPRTYTAPPTLECNRAGELFVFMRTTGSF